MNYDRQYCKNSHDLSIDSRKFQLLHTAITLDHIWFVRNHLVHNDVHSLIPQSIQKISSTIRAHILAWNDSTTTHSLWTPPLFGSFKANFDVTVTVDFVAAAVVINDAVGGDW
jgi:hypothetical protein